MGRILQMRTPPAYTQRLVTTRLLDRLHDWGTQISRMQRIYPRAWLNGNPPVRPPELHSGARYRPAEVRGTRPIRIRLRRAGGDHRVPARILT